jgi:hypothetical protein
LEQPLLDHLVRVEKGVDVVCRGIAFFRAEVTRGLPVRGDDLSHEQADVVLRVRIPDAKSEVTVVVRRDVRNSVRRTNDRSAVPVAVITPHNPIKVIKRVICLSRSLPDIPQ